MFETKIITAGPASIEDELNHFLDGSWEIKGVVCTTQNNIRVFLQRHVLKLPDPNQTDLGFPDSLCHCENPLGVIGSDKCKRCGGIIKDK